MQKAELAALVLLAAAMQVPQTPRFTAGVDVVEMDVSVLDKDHKPVRGLKASDFTILEDGKPQKIVAFSEEGDTPPAPPSAPWMRQVPKDVETNEVADKHLFVIILDDGQITPSTALNNDPRDGYMVNASYRMKTMRNVAQRAIEMMGDGDEAALLFAVDNFKGQTFTSDRSKLLKALDGLAMGPKYEVHPEDPRKTDCQPLWFTSGALRMAVESLSSVPHRRKTILYVSPGTYVPLMGPPPEEYKYCADKTQGEIFEAFRMAQLANVNIYSIDPNGLTNYFRAKAIDEQRDRHEYLREVAENTGGRAVIDSNDDPGKVAEIIDETRSYYLLGYELTDRKGDGKFHRVEVKVDRPGVEVHSRKTRYDAAPPKPGASKPAVAPTEGALGEFMPKNDLFAEATVAPFRSATGAVVMVALGGRLPALASPPARDRIDVLVRAFTPDGLAQGSHQQLMQVVLEPTEPPPAAGAVPAKGSRFETTSSVDLKPGRYSLRIALHSAAVAKTGSVYTDVTVPDFVKEPLTLSGVMLTASFGSSGRGDILNSLVPTTMRAFTKGDRMQAFLRVYQGGTSAPAGVTMRTKIVDEHNAAVVDRSESLPAGAFAAARQADYFVRLPIESLKPGEYWLSIEAAAGKVTSRRDVRFTVK